MPEGRGKTKRDEPSIGLRDNNSSGSQQGSCFSFAVEVSVVLLALTPLAVFPPSWAAVASLHSRPPLRPPPPQTLSLKGFSESGVCEEEWSLCRNAV